MTLADLDREIAQFQSAAQSISANLIALEQDPNRQLLEIAPLRGESEVRWRDARTAISDLWSMSATFNNFLDRVRTVRGTKQTLSAPREHEIHALLRTDAIELSASPIALADRDLLGSGHADSRCRADDLVARMQAAFDRAIAVIAAVGTAWDKLVPRVADLRVTLAETSTRAGTLTSDVRPELDRVELRLTDLGDALLSDPLSVTEADVAGVESAVAVLGADLRRACDLRDAMASRIAEAHALIDEVRAVDDAARVEHIAAGTKIAGVAPSAPARLSDRVVAEWEPVQEMIDEESWRIAAAAFEQWRRRANAARQAADANLDACRQPLRLRNQLRGRLDAYLAKAAHLGLIENEDVAVAYACAHDALFTAPTDLTRAAELVHDYQVALQESLPRPKATQ